MGMYDTIRCHYPLPGLGDPGAIEFQTKDLDCQLDRYRITAEGVLERQDYRVEDRSDPNATGLWRPCGMMTRIPLEWVPTDFTGTLRFYGDSHTGELMLLSVATGKDTLHPDPPEIPWHEYEAEFQGGRLVTVRRVEEGQPEERP